MNTCIHTCIHTCTHAHIRTYIIVLVCYIYFLQYFCPFERVNDEVANYIFHQVGTTLLYMAASSACIRRYN